MPHRRHQLGKRRTALVAGAVYCASRSLAYIPAVRKEPPQDPIIIMAGGRPEILALYLALWAATAAFCLSRLPSGRLWAPMTAMATLMALWGTAWGVGWLLNPGTLWWQTCLTYWGPAVLVSSMSKLIPDRVEGDVRE